MFGAEIGIYFLLLLLVMALSAFFSGSEAALLSVKPFKVRQMLEKRVAGARRMAELVERPTRFLPTVLVGNNLVNTAAATLGTLIAVQFFTDAGIGATVATVGIAALLIIFCESIPKAIAARYSERVALLVSPPVTWIEKVMFPLVAPVQALNRWVISRLGKMTDEGLVTQEELKLLVSLGRESGAVDETEAGMILRMLRITERQVQGVMTPRTEIVWVRWGMLLSEFLEFNARQYFSRFPVFGRDLDDVIGVLAARDVLQAMGRGELEPSESVTELVQPAYFVPETKPILEAITEMRQSGAHMAIAVDEYGGVAGLVTFRELMEEIVGGVKEAGIEEPYRAVNERTYEVKGNTRVDDLNDATGLGLPEGDYDTIAGLIFKLLGRIPRQGETLECGNILFEVAQMQGPKVVKVTITRRESAQL